MNMNTYTIQTSELDSGTSVSGVSLGTTARKLLAEADNPLRLSASQRRIWDEAERIAPLQPPEIDLSIFKPFTALQRPQIIRCEVVIRVQTVNRDNEEGNEENGRETIH